MENARTFTTEQVARIINGYKKALDEKQITKEFHEKALEAYCIVLGDEFMIKSFEIAKELRTK